MKLKVLITTFAILILSTAIYIGAKSKHASSPSVIKSKALPSTTATKQAQAETSFGRSSDLPSRIPQPRIDKVVPNANNYIVDKMRDDIDMDLKQIQHRRYVETLNDPRANAAEKEEALKFMGAYLEKLTRYMKMRNQQIQAMMEQNNG